MEARVPEPRTKLVSPLSETIISHLPLKGGILLHQFVLSWVECAQSGPHRLVDQLTLQIEHTLSSLNVVLVLQNIAHVQPSMQLHRREMIQTD